MDFRTIRSLVPLLCALAGAGCAHWYEDAAEPAPLSEWVGQPDRKLVMTLGAPDAVYEMQDGRRVLTWRRGRTEKFGGESYTATETRVVDGKKKAVPVTRQIPVTTMRYECTMNFELDATGYVVDYRAEGNDCKNYPAPD